MVDQSSCMDPVKTYSPKVTVYRVSQKKVPTFENSQHHDYYTDLNHTNCN